MLLDGRGCHDHAVFLADRAPTPVVALQQRVGFGWARAAGGIDGYVGRAIVGPGIEDGLHDAPSGLDIVGALEQRWITHHAIVDQCLVAGARRGMEMVPVVELHRDTFHADAGSGDFGAEPQGHAFLRLDQNPAYRWA